MWDLFMLLFLFLLLVFFLIGFVSLLIVMFESPEIGLAVEATSERVGGGGGGGGGSIVGGGNLCKEIVS